VISGPAPISIRDQVLRGVIIAERLFETREISAKRPLVVVGAGAGGVSTAIHAAARGISTTLVERNNAGFLTQRLATTRVIDPTQYDWPLDHCYIGRLPWAPYHRPLPLSFAAARADQLAIRWQHELRIATTAFPHLTVRFSTTVSSVAPWHRNLIDVTLAPGPTINAGAIVNAKGFGNEQCGIEYPRGTLCYEGQPFWGPDAFTTLNPSKHNVLISGAGDGALQDYLRIVSGFGRAIDIVRHCNIPSSILRAIQSAEDRSHRGRSWATNQPRNLKQKHEGPYFWELEQVHQLW
jgi:thioredoxin reductase